MKTKTCPICGTRFTAIKTDQQCCGRACGAKYSRAQAQRTRRANSVPCRVPGCERWILNRYKRHFCTEHIRRAGMEDAVPVAATDPPRPSITKLQVLASTVPQSCPKCGGLVSKEQGFLMSEQDTAYQQSFYCLNCGATGHENPRNFPQHPVLADVRARVQQLAVT